MKVKPANDNNLAILIKALKDTHPNVADIHLIKYLNTEKEQYFYLTPLEFSRLDDACLKTVVENIKNFPLGEIMGS